MNSVVILTVFLLGGIVSSPTIASEDVANRSLQERLDKMVSDADQLYEAGQKDEAKTGYLLASYMGSPEAHYNLAYRYIVDNREYHLEQAAIHGHEEALRLYLDHTFYRAGSIRQANPHKAAAVYTRAVSENPNINIKYLDPETVPFYDVWELAEEASRPSEIFGSPDPELVFWLITHGGVVPSETDTAVKVYYNRWKAGGPIEFNLCEFVTSGMGATYCAARNAEEREKLRKTDIDVLMRELEPAKRLLLQTAYQEMTDFVTQKARGEEMHGGTAFAATTTWSIDEQKQEFIALVEKIINGKIPRQGLDLDAEDAKLNDEYRLLLNMIEKNSDLSMGLNASMVSLEEFRDTQRQWIKYRNAMEKFYQSVTGDDPNNMRSLMTRKRNEDLASLKRLIR